VSEHHDAAAATEAAVEHAGAEGSAEVLLHDLYSRVRPIVCSGGTNDRRGRF
jgi:hypothetical protein